MKQKEKDIEKIPIKKDPFLGSIRAEDKDIFHKACTTKIASWFYNENLHGTFSERCLTKKLIELFEKFKVKYQIDLNPNFDLVKGLPDISVLDIEQDGKNHVRIHFGGITQPDFDDKRIKIENYLKDNDVPFENYCLYVCVTGKKQKQITDKYLEDLEKANK